MCLIAESVIIVWSFVKKLMVNGGSSGFKRGTVAMVEVTVERKYHDLLGTESGIPSS